MASKQENEAGTNDEINWNVISYVISSHYRLAVLERLSEGPATPTRIASDTEQHVAHISRALQRLRERDQVDLLVPEDRTKGRVYGLTDEGERTWKIIDEEELL
jgi:hypothetical protein